MNVVVYLVLSINTYLETYALGVFSLGCGSIGPTEARIALIVLNAAMALGAGLSFEVAGHGMTVLDLVGLGLSALAIAAHAVRATHTFACRPSASPRGFRRRLDGRPRAAAH